MKRARLILHIGVENTGTTSLQDFFRINALNYLRKGIVIPDFLGWNNHTLFTCAFMSEDRRDEMTLANGMDSPSERKKIKEKVLGKLKELSLKHNDGIFIISSEHLQSRLNRQEELADMRNRLEDIFSEVNIFVYLRKPIDIARSHLSTIIKWNSHTSMNIQDPWEEEIEAICNYKKTISLWSSVFGEKNINVRLYKKEFLIGGNIISDFIDATGIGVDTRTDLNLSSNPKLNLQGMQMLCDINKNFPRITSSGYDERHQGIVELFEKHFSTPPFYEYTPEEERMYKIYYKQSDEFIFRKYFNSRNHLWGSEKKIKPKTFATLLRMFICRLGAACGFSASQIPRKSTNNPEALLSMFLDSWLSNREKIITLESRLKETKYIQKK